MYAVYLDKKLMLVGDHPIDKEEIAGLHDDLSMLTIVEREGMCMMDVWDGAFKPKILQDKLMADRLKSATPQMTDRNYRQLLILLSWLVCTNNLFNNLSPNSTTLKETDKEAYIQWFNVNYQLLVLVDDEEFSVCSKTLYEENARWQNFFETIVRLNNE